MTLANHLLLATFAAVAPQETNDPPLLRLLEADRERALMEEIQARPDDAREALQDLFRLSLHTDGAEQRALHLMQAEQLAHLYERAWSDSFLIQRVAQFRNWSLDERAQKLAADSLRRAGIDAYYGEGPDAAIRIWERSLGRYRALNDLAGQAAALGNLGAAYYASRQLERALQHYTRSLELAEAAGDERIRGNALGNIASVHKDWGEYSLAAEYYGRALEVRRRAGDRRGEAADLNNLGLVRKALGDLKGAETQFRRALDLNRTDGRLRAAAENLTNLANVATIRGEYDEALQLYSQALALRRETGDRMGEALVLENLGLLQLRWSDYPVAVSSLQKSAAILEDLGLAEWSAEVHAELAAAHEAMGQLGAALEELDLAVRQAAGDEYLAPMLALQRADLLARLNEFEPAAELYRKALRGYERLDDPVGQAQAEQGLADLNVAREDYAAAEEALSRALLIQKRFDDARPASLSYLLLGDVQRLKGEPAAAEESYRRSLATHQALGDVVAEATALGALADLQRERGRLETAETGYRAALKLLEETPALPVHSHLHLGLGLTLQSAGQTQEAAEELRLAIAQIETIAGSVPSGEDRYAYLDDKWQAYAELARIEATSARIEMAFELSERMRARHLVDLLWHGRPADDPGGPSPVRHEQNLRRRIGELRERIAQRSSVRDPAETTYRNLEDELARAQTQYQEALKELEETRPAYAELVTGATASAAAVRRALPEDALLIEFLVHDDWTLALLLSSDTMRAVELPLTRRTLHQLTDFLRGTLLLPRDEPLDDLWRTPLRRLYGELIEPLEERGYLAGHRLLIVVPHGELHYVPFQALLQPGEPRERFLVESYELAYVPSASVWTRIESRRSAIESEGLLALAPQPRSLVHSEREVRAIGDIWPGSDVVVGPGASEARFREVAADRRILHLATFGVLNDRNPLFSYLRLNPAGPTDGRLEVHEVFGIDLAADLVVLSACETGLGSGLRSEVPAGDDWLGLVQAFLYAGAQSVVASLWPVDDEATARLMADFHRTLRRGASKSAALAEAQRTLIRTPEYEHPYYWAAFKLIGAVR